MINKVIAFLFVFFLFNSSLFATDVTDFINKKNCDQIIDKQVYTICYDYKLKGAKYVAYQLDGNKVNAVNIKKRPSFYTEKNIKKKYRSHTRDYTHSGYDRGHLANDASFDWSEDSLNATYSLANIIPQARKVNRYTWTKVERYARYVAVKLGYVNVINVVEYSDNPQRIGKHKIAVPKGFYKVIYNKDEDFERCFYYKNDNNINTKEDKLKQHLVDCKVVSDLLNK